jgi:hypothetical protein
VPKPCHRLQLDNNLSPGWLCYDNCAVVMQGASGKMTDLREKYNEAEQQRQHGESCICFGSNIKQALLLETSSPWLVAADTGGINRDSCL